MRFLLLASLLIHAPSVVATCGQQETRCSDLSEAATHACLNFAEASRDERLAMAYAHGIESWFEKFAFNKQAFLEMAEINGFNAEEIIPSDCNAETMVSAALSEVASGGGDCSPLFDGVKQSIGRAAESFNGCRHRPAMARYLQFLGSEIANGRLPAHAEGLYFSEGGELRMSCLSPAAVGVMDQITGQTIGAIGNSLSGAVTGGGLTMVNQPLNEEEASSAIRQMLAPGPGPGPGPGGANSSSRSAGAGSPGIGTDNASVGRMKAQFILQLQQRARLIRANKDHLCRASDADVNAVFSQLSNLLQSGQVLAQDLFNESSQASCRRLDAVMEVFADYVDDLIRALRASRSDNATDMIRLYRQANESLQREIAQQYRRWGGNNLKQRVQERVARACQELKLNLTTGFCRLPGVIVGDETMVRAAYRRFGVTLCPDQSPPVDEGRNNALFGYNNFLEYERQRLAGVNDRGCAEENRRLQGLCASGPNLSAIGACMKRAVNRDCTAQSTELRCLLLAHERDLTPPAQAEARTHRLQDEYSNVLGSADGESRPVGIAGVPVAGGGLKPIVNPVNQTLASTNLGAAQASRAMEQAYVPGPIITQAASPQVAAAQQEVRSAETQVQEAYAGVTEQRARVEAAGPTASNYAELLTQLATLESTLSEARRQLAQRKEQLNAVTSAEALARGVASGDEEMSARPGSPRFAAVAASVMGDYPTSVAQRVSTAALDNLPPPAVASVASAVASEARALNAEARASGAALGNPQLTLASGQAVGAVGSVSGVPAEGENAQNFLAGSEEVASLLAQADGRPVVVLFQNRFWQISGSVEGPKTVRQVESPSGSGGVVEIRQAVEQYAGRYADFIQRLQAAARADGQLPPL